MDLLSLRSSVTFSALNSNGMSMLHQLMSKLQRSSPKQARRIKSSTLDYQECEARRLLTTFFVDAASGSDSNPGTADLPFQSYLPLVSAYGQADPNVGRIELQPGDEVIFRAGEYDETFQLPGSDVHHGFRIRGIDGTANDPIVLRGEQGAVFTGAAPNNSEFTKIELFDTSHVIIEGVEVTGLGTGIQITESSDILVRDTWIHDIDGQASSIIAGLAISQSSDVEATENLIHDNYDRSTASFNSFNVEFDENVGYVEFHNNYVFNTDGNVNTGTGAGVKHDGAGLLEVHHNVIQNAANAGIALDTRLAFVHHNLLLDSEALWLVPNESLSANEELHDIRISNNTLIDQTAGDRVGGGLNFSARVQSSDGKIEFNNNIVVDLDQQSQAQGILNLAPYGSNEEYQFWIEEGRIEADGNVYFNPNHEARFDIYSAVGRGDLGGLYTFEQWQQLGFDQNGSIVDPQLDSTYRATNTEVEQAGWYQGESQRLTVLSKELDPLGSDHSTVISITRSGDSLDLQSRLSVKLTVTNSEAIDLPDTVVFQPGQRTLEVQVTNRLQGSEKQIAAVRISATADGFENNVSSWLRLSGGSLDVDGPSDVNEEPSVDKPTVINGSGIGGETPSHEADVPELEEDAKEPDVQLAGNDMTEPKSTMPETMSDVAVLDSGLLKLPGTVDETVEIEFSFVERLAQYNNEIGIATVQADGSIDGISPSEPGYARQVLESGQTIFAKGAGVGDQSVVELAGQSHVVFYLIQNANKNQVLEANPENRIDAGPIVFFSVLAANPDKFSHERTTSSDPNQFRMGWEDLLHGGDQSYTDAVINLQIRTVRTQSGNTTPAEQPRKPLLHNTQLAGDVDRNGEVSLRDAVFAFRAIHDPNLRASGQFLPDVNDDGVVNFDDVFAAINFWIDEID